MTNKFLFFNFFLYSSSCCCCCCCSILLQCSMQYRVIVVNRARSFPFVCRFFFISPSSVSLSISSLLCCSRCVHTFTKWMLMPLWHEQLSPSIPNRKRTQEMKANKKKNSRTYKHEKSYCDSFIECVLLKCMRDVANGTHYNLHRRLACLSNWLQHRTRKREWKGIKEFHVHTHTNTRIHISSTQSINRQVLELKLEETLQRKKLKKAATTTTSNETSKHRIKLHASNKYGLFFTSSFDVRFSRCIALYFFFFIVVNRRN